MTWAKTEGTICAPETSHAIAATIEEAIKAKEEGKEKVILFNYSGHGLMDLVGYDKYIDGKLTDYAPSDEELARFIEPTMKLPKPPMQKSGKW
jgi:tryptophan synthase beta chain